MSQIQDFPGVQVVSVVSRQARNGRTMYDISLSNGMTATAFDASLATKAHSLTGQSVTARIEATDKGYLNLKDIGQGVLNGGGAAGAQPFQPQQQFPQQGGFTQPGVAVQTGIPQQGDARETRIVRGNGLNAATALFGPVYAGQPDVGDDVLLTRVLRFATAFEHFVKTGQNIAQAAQTAAIEVAPEASPEQVAEAVNAVAPGAVKVGAPVEQAAAAPEPAAATPASQQVPW